MTTTPTAQTTSARLAAAEPYVLAFGGQATPWRQSLRELAGTDQSLARALTTIDEAVADRLSPVATELLTTTPRGLRLLDEQAEPTTPETQSGPDGADVSVPGILLAQHATLMALDDLGVDLFDNRPVATIGHSQGGLGVALLEALMTGGSHRRQPSDAVVQVHALARLIGDAAARTTARIGMSPASGATPMLSVRGTRRDVLDQVVAGVRAHAPISVGVTNGRLAHILSGLPADLAGVVTALERLADASAQDRKQRRRGGAVLAPVTEYLPTTVPFHTQLLAPAVDDTVAWAQACGLDPDLARDLATAVLIDPVDWPATVQAAAAHPSRPRLVVDLGPGTVLTRLTQAALAGTGLAVAPAGTSAALDGLDRPGRAPQATVDRSRFAPRLVRLPDGRLSLDTAFTRLTGRSAVLLAGMTPTTQRHVHGPLPVEPAPGQPAPAVQGARRGRSGGRNRGLRGDPRARRGGGPARALRG